jgi:hypothetical protein
VRALQIIRLYFRKRVSCEITYNHQISVAMCDKNISDESILIYLIESP